MAFFDSLLSTKVKLHEFFDNVPERNVHIIDWYCFHPSPCSLRVPVVLPSLGAGGGGGCLEYGNGQDGACCPIK